jgi:hypothetical protein
MTSETFLYGGRAYPVVTQDGKEYADFGEKGLKLLKRNESGELVKGFPGREPGSANGTSNATNKATGSIAPNSGLWAKMRKTVAKALQIEPENVGIIVTNKTVTVNADEVGTTKSGRTIVSALCTWSCDKDNWFAGLPGIMSIAAGVQDEHTKASIVGLGETLDNWHNK